MKISKIIISEILKDKKAVFFDMDGVLYDSMGAHADAWSNAFRHYGIDFPAEKVYENEGRTAQSTINLAYQQNEQRDATSQEIDLIYSKKTELIDVMPDIVSFSGAKILMEYLKKQGIAIWIVTGSSQGKFLDALLNDFEGYVIPDQIISGNDVKHGKPNPEPYLMALKKSGFNSSEVVVIENAPLGILSAKAAGIFTVGINTGILHDSVLFKSGANVVFRDWDEVNAEM